MLCVKKGYDRMKQRAKLLAFMTAAGMVCAVGFALVSVEGRGTWPRSWPKELDSLRDRARTVGVANGIQETVYEIPFDNREEFERAWPCFVALKSKGAPIILEGSPSTYHGRALASGVRVLWPAGGAVGLPDGTRLPTEAPWPDSARLDSGELPEYVIRKGGALVPYTGQEHLGFRFRARVDIVLITDGVIVNTNNIEIPTQTPIIDKRVKK
jgi:hypothetical protein